MLEQQLQTCHWENLPRIQYVSIKLSTQNIALILGGGETISDFVGQNSFRTTDMCGQFATTISVAEHFAQKLYKYHTTQNKFMSPERPGTHLRNVRQAGPTVLARWYFEQQKGVTSFRKNVFCIFDTCGKLSNMRVAWPVHMGRHRCYVNESQRHRLETKCFVESILPRQTAHRRASLELWDKLLHESRQ